MARHTHLQVFSVPPSHVAILVPSLTITQLRIRCILLTHFHLPSGGPRETGAETAIQGTRFRIVGPWCKSWFHY